MRYPGMQYKYTDNGKFTNSHHHFEDPPLTVKPLEETAKVSTALARLQSLTGRAEVTEDVIASPAFQSGGVKRANPLD